MNQRLNPLDASWLALETADTPMHVGALLVFREPEGAHADYVAALAGQLRTSPPATRPWNLQLQSRWRNPLRARWTESGALDTDYHFRHSALAAPGGERELGVLISGLHSNALDLEHPPWECHLIEGLHDRQFAVYIKLHHALMDAASFMRLVTASLVTRTGEAPRPPWATGAESARGRAGEQLLEALRGHLSGAQLPETARDLGRAFGRLWRGARRPEDGLRAPYSAPRSVLNTHIGPQRRFATQQYPLARLQRAAGHCGVGVDELLFYLCGSVLRRFFKEYNALPDAPLLAAVPAQRAGHEEDYGSIGFVSLATHLADPNRRLDEVSRSTRASQAHLAELPDALVPGYTLMMMAPYLLGQVSRLDRFVPALINLAITTATGPVQPLYLGDARLEALYPMFPLTQGHALTISAIEYAGTLNVGISGAHETLPGLQRMAVYMGLALEELEQLIAAGEIHGRE